MFVYSVRTAETYRLTTKTCMPAHKRNRSVSEYRSDPLGLNLADIRSAPMSDNSERCIKSPVGVVLNQRTPRSSLLSDLSLRGGSML